MRTIFNILKCLLLLAAGLYLLLVPYDQLKGYFPNALSPVMIKISGGVIVLCGIIILLALIIQ